MSADPRIAVVAEALHDAIPAGCTRRGACPERAMHARLWDQDARTAIDVLTPPIEAGVREAIAQAIEEHDVGWEHIPDGPLRDGFVFGVLTMRGDAARIARNGETP